MEMLLAADGVLIIAKSAITRRPASCALFLSSSPTTRATARTKATASAERRPGAPAEVLSQQLARRPGADPREYALLQLPAGMQKLVCAACRLAHAAPGSDERRWMDQSWRAPDCTMWITRACVLRANSEHDRKSNF